MDTTRNSRSSEINPVRLVGGIASVLLVLITLFMSGSIVEFLDAKDVMVIQYPNGGLTVFTTPGPHMQWFGSVSKYQRQASYSFSAAANQGSTRDESLPVQFADGAHGKMSGTILWRMPVAERDILALHRVTGSQEAVEQKYIRPIIQKSIYFTGPLMTSTESYAERKTELLADIEDQIANGVYKTEKTSRKVVENEQERVITASAIVKATDGTYARQEVSPLREFNIVTSNLAINHVDYDGEVEKQIQKQQQIRMDVQTSIADALKAQQRKLTIEANGAASVAQAHVDQEIEKTKVVVKAEAALAVATKDNEAAEQYRQGMLKRADGDATYRKKVMEADGALQQRLDAQVKIATVMADAIKNHQGSWTPNVVMGSSNAGGGNSATDLMNLLTIQAAKAVGLDHKQ